MATEKDELDLRLFRVLARAYLSVMEQDRRNVRGFGFNLTEFAVLELLYHKGPHPLQQIGGKILITSGSITYVINKLAGKGLVVREASPEDGRVFFAALSAKGRALMEEIFPAHAQNIAAMLGGLDDDEKLATITLLKKLGLSVRGR